MRRIALLLMVLLLAGCGATKVVKQNVIVSVDQICADIEFTTGEFDRYYVNRKNVVFSQQQLDDIKYLRDFCTLPKEQRKDYGYGWLTGAAADNAVQAIVPLLGRDALSIGTSIRLW
jgi:hypothetical protein